MKLISRPALLVLTLCIFCTPLFAQMAITSGRSSAIDIRNAYQVHTLTVDALIREQVAEVVVSQTIHNPNSSPLEVELYFPLPDNGVVQNFTLMVDGREFPGKLLLKQEASNIYEGIVRSKKDPALLEYVGYGLFKTSIFPIPAGGKREITLKYSQLCNRKLDLIEFAYPLGTQKFSSVPVKNISITARISSNEGIKTLYSSSHDIQTERSGDNRATVKMEQHNIVPDRDFRLAISLAKGAVGATLISYKPEGSGDGYFMLLASPEIKKINEKRIGKNVVFVIDHSGSMGNQKMEQARSALKFVLKNLHEGDCFNIVVYDDRVETFKMEMQPFTPAILKEAENYVDNIQSAGGTNINDALVESMKMVNNKPGPCYILFMTDGLPSTGTTDELTIARNCVEANKKGVKLFTFGVGDDVNARLLDRLSSQNKGTSEYVEPGENLETVVAQLYRNIENPSLTDINISISNTDIRQTYPQVLPDLFDGGQLVWVGRYNRSGKTQIKISGMVGSTSQSFEFPATLAGDKEGSSNAYVEKLWATRRIGHIIDQIDLHGKNTELVDELVKLSKEYGILTPYTSFLAREDENLADVGNLRFRTMDNLKDLEEVSGAEANNQRVEKKSYKIAMNSHSVPQVQGKAENANIKNLGNKTFYFRNNQWVEASITETDAKNAISITQFSDDYFNLSKQQEASSNQYLTLKEPVVVKLNGKVYRIENSR
jgi:Ca-activated chloride channel family protein